MRKGTRTNPGKLFLFFDDDDQQNGLVWVWAVYRTETDNWERAGGGVPFFLFIIRPFLGWWFVLVF
jgi:hypothetical protein